MKLLEMLKKNKKKSDDRKLGCCLSSVHTECSGHHSSSSSFVNGWQYEVNFCATTNGNSAVSCRESVRLPNARITHTDTDTHTESVADDDERLSMFDDTVTVKVGESLFFFLLPILPTYQNVNLTKINHWLSQLIILSLRCQNVTKNNPHKYRNNNKYWKKNFFFF